MVAAPDRELSGESFLPHVNVQLKRGCEGWGVGGGRDGREGREGGREGSESIQGGILRLLLSLATPLRQGGDRRESNGPSAAGHGSRGVVGGGDGYRSEGGPGRPQRRVRRRGVGMVGRVGRVGRRVGRAITQWWNR